MASSSRSVLVVLSFFAIYFIWGSTYMLNKIVVTELPPFMIAGIRFVVAGSLIFVIAKFMGLSLQISRKQLYNCSLAGLLFLTLGNGLAVWSLQYLDSSFAALEISAQPLVVLFLMRILQGKKIKSESVIGIVLGIVGIFLLVSQKELVQKEGALQGILMILLCMLCWGYGSLFVGKADLPQNSFVNTGYQMFIGGILLVLCSFGLSENWTSPVVWSTPVLLSVLGLIVFGGIIAFTAFNFLLKVVSPEKVATSTYVNPIVALFLGWFFLDEKVTLMSVVAAVILLTGVYFINSSKNDKAPKRSLRKWLQRRV